MASPNIFHEYDIRGKYPQEINEALAERIGLSLAEYWHHKALGGAVMVGRDARSSSVGLSLSLIRGLTAGGFNVDLAQEITTDAFYFAVATGDYAGGVMVTASHNPVDNNGFKIVNSNAEVVNGPELDLIAQLTARTDEFKSPISGDVRLVDPLVDFIAFTTSNLAAHNLTRLKVAVDPGNGYAETVLTKLLPKLPIDNIRLNEKIDGTFPGRGPNPLLNHEALSRSVIEQGCALGVAWDADGDRILLVDEKGQIIPSDFLLILLAKYYSKKIPNLKVVCDSRSTKVLEEMPEIKLIRTSVGRDAIERAMKENGAFLGAETSGHIYYEARNDGKVWFVENTYLTFLSLLAILGQNKQPLSDLIAPYKKTSKSDEINFEVKSKEAVLLALRERFADAKVETADGVTINYPDWWFNARPSKTENLIRLNVEANNQKLLQEKLEELEDLIKSF